MVLAEGVLQAVLDLSTACLVEQRSIELGKVERLQ